jgi:hypothetical protein
MKRLVCMGCGAGENLDDPTGDIHSVQLIDLTSPYEDTGGPDRPITEDLCSNCRTLIRRNFFGETESELLDMPLMKAV